MDYSSETEIIDFLDLVNFTLSNEFVEKWRHLYSEYFLKCFQKRIFEALKNQKPVKVQNLVNYLHKKYNYSPKQIYHFFNSIDINLYKPLVTGELRETY